MMRQDRFTEQAQAVLQASQEMVRQQRHTQWDVEHVLLALVGTRDGLARDVLQKMGVEPQAVAAELSGYLSRAPKAEFEVVQIYTTPRIVRMLEAANAEADRLQDEYVGVEHLLIAISDEREGEAAKVLREFEITKERIYNALRQVRGSARVSSPTAESQYQALSRYSTDLTRARPRWQARPDHRS